jgi:uncharacterized protein with HEPN domain
MNARDRNYLQLALSNAETALRYRNGAQEAWTDEGMVVDAIAKRIAHDYGGLNLEVLKSTVNEDLRISQIFSRSCWMKMSVEGE